MGVNSELPKSIKGYEILERLAAGGFGVVYRVKQSSTFGREVAMKVILPKYANQPEFIRRFEAEAEIIARLEHPHIVPLYDYWRDPSGAYLVMRYLKGGNVKDVLEKDGDYELEAASQLLNQVASALEFAHRNNVVHRDIKPGNILLDEDGIAYVADFGIAKDLVKKDGHETAPESIVGSLDYISPEQARSEPVSGRTDIYSLGVTLYEMLTGEHPFKGFSTIEKLYKHINDPLPDITTLDDAVCDNINAVIHKATAKNPAERYADVLELAHAFREAANLDATEPALSIIERLTMKEHEFLQHLVDGLTVREIAATMFISEAGVKFHRKNAYKKLGVKTRVQAVIKARELDLIYSDTTLDAPSSAPSADSSIYLPEPINPYKGLQAFQMSDVQDFFGREKFIERLLNKMQEGHDFQRFLAIVGPSGSGKSSLVKAGLLPALLQGKLNDNDKWYPVEVLPGNHPLDKLEVALQSVANEQAENIYQHLSRDERGLVRIADLILPSDETELLIYIDQFEEVFTLCQDEDERQHFLNLLYTAATAPRSRVRVIVTLRADYYDKPLHYHQFGEMLRNRIETILPLGAKELERAIVGPAERVHLQFETGLVAQIVSEMTYQAAALPLLQYALTELFNQRQERLLTHEAYQAIGGAVGALANRAEELYQELDSEGRALCKQLFLRLVTLGEGAEDTRRRATFIELISISESKTDAIHHVPTNQQSVGTAKETGQRADLMEEIIDAFADYRLLTLDHDENTRQPTVEVAHEAILREWERLRQWLNDSRDDIREERILSQNTNEWMNNQRDNGYLLREGQLQRFVEWREKTGMSLTPLETEFIEASIRQHEIEEQKRIEQETREKILQKEAFEQTRKALVRTRALVAVFVLAAILSGGFGVFALLQRNAAIEAERETADALDVAQRSGLAFAANAALEINEIDLAIALALESVGDDEANVLPETLRLLERIENQAGPRIWREREGFDCSPRYSRDRRYYVWSDCVNAISVWDTKTGGNLVQMSLPEPFSFDTYFFAEFSHDGKYLLLAHLEEYPGTVEVMLLDMETWETVATYTLKEGLMWLYFTGDSSIIATMSATPENLARTHEDNLIIGDSIVLRHAETGEPIREYRFDDHWIQDFDLSLDGTLGVVNGWSGTQGRGVDDYRAMIFDMETGNILKIIDRPHNDNHPETNNWSASASFNADATQLMLSGYPNYMIEIDTGETIGHLHQVQGSQIRPPDFKFEYVMNTNEGNPQFINPKTGEVETFYVNFAFLTSEPDKILTADLGRMDEFQIWDIDGRLSNIFNLEQRQFVSGVKYSPDGERLVVMNSGWGCADFGNQDNAIYDADTYEVIGHLGGDTNTIWSLDWSPDGRYIATSTKTEAILWDADSGQEIRRFSGTQDCVMHLRFTHDGQFLIGTHGSWFPQPRYDVPPYLIMWDVATGEEVRRYELPVDSVPNWGITNLHLHPTRNIVEVDVLAQFTEGCKGDTCKFVNYFVNLDTGELTEIEQPLFSSGFTNNDQFVGTYQNHIFVIDIQTGKILRQWASLDSQIFGSTVSDDGHYLATGSGPLAFESVVSLWDIETGNLLRRYTSDGQQTFIVNLDFRPDGTQLVTSAFEPVVRIWDVDTQSTLNWVRDNRVVRDFTCTEREQYRIEPLCEEEA